MAKMNLKQTYTRNGATFGPGETEVPDDAVKDLKEREDDFQKYLDEGGEAPAPVTPASSDVASFDPRLRRPGTVPDREALVRAGRQADIVAPQEQREEAAKEAADRAGTEGDKGRPHAGTAQDTAGQRHATRESVRGAK